MGLSIGLDSAVKALRAHQVAVDTASHNIANANTPGFSRQRVLLRPVGVSGSNYFGRDALIGRVGFGVDAHDVNRVRDVFLDFQARQTLSSKSQWDTHARALGKTEAAFAEPSDSGISEMLGQFWSAWHDVVNDPESSAARTTIVNAATTLSGRIRMASQGLVAERADLDRQVAGMAERINAAAGEVAALNFQIKQVELSGDVANDLRDRRDFLLDDLSKYAQISYAEQADKTITVYLGSHELVQSNQSRVVEAIPDLLNPGMKKLIFSIDSEDVTTSAGELRGLLDARDRDIPGLSTKLDQLASGLIASTNALHSTGFGLDGSTGLAFFTGTTAVDMDVNAVVAAAPQKVAAASGVALPGDGANALRIADLQNSLTMATGSLTFDQFYANMVSVFGADVSRSEGQAESSGLLVDHIESLRESVKGVNIDEEVTNLNQAQHAYQAAARVISVIDQMLDTLINRTAV